MIKNNEAKMKPTYEQLEKMFLALCDDTEMASRKIVGAAGGGYSDRAACLAISLNDHARACKQGYFMRSEQSDGYDLAALTINAKDCSPE